MQKNKNLIVIVVIIVGILVLLFTGNTSKPETVQLPIPVVTKESIQSSTTVPSAITEVTIKATENSFEPMTITIKGGTRVVWVNESGSVSNVSSSPHPAHTDYPSLNLEDFKDGASVSLVFDTAGTYKYHNHLNAKQYGTITVEE